MRIVLVVVWLPIHMVVVRPDVRQTHELAPPICKLSAETWQLYVVVVGCGNIRHGDVLPGGFPETETDGAHGDEGGGQSRQVKANPASEERRGQCQVDLFVLMRFLPRELDCFCRGDIAADHEKERNHGMTRVHEPETRQLEDATIEWPVTPSKLYPPVVSPHQMAKEDKKGRHAAEAIQVSCACRLDRRPGG